MLGGDLSALYSQFDVQAEGSAAQWRMYGFKRLTGMMSYNLKIIQYDLPIAAATTPITLQDENILAVYIKRDTIGQGTTEVASTITGIVARRDKVTVASLFGSGLQDLNDFSDLLNPTDSLSAANQSGRGLFNSDLAELALAQPGEPAEFLSDEFQMDVTSTAALTLSILVFSADFSPNKLRQTQLDTAATIQASLTRKNEMGRTRPIQTLKVASGA